MGVRTVALLAFAGCGPGEIAPGSGDTDDPATHATQPVPPTYTTPPGTVPTTTGTGTTPSVPGEPELLFDSSHVLVIPTGLGMQFMANDGTMVGQLGWQSLVGNCPSCTGEGASADGDGLLVSWEASANKAGFGRINAGGTLDFQIDGLQFPHDAVRDPSDQSIMVPEAFADQVTWYPGDGSSDQPLRVLDDHDDGYSQELPSGIDLATGDDGTTFLVLNNRGGFPDGGILTMWDITNPDAPSRLWRFPAHGALDTPHGAVIRRFGGQYWILWAHSYGGPGGDGSIGLLVTDDLAVQPQYVADLVPPAPVGPLDFVRGVELTTDGWLWITDSGPERGPGNDGRIIKAPMPILTPTGATGEQGVDQVFVNLPGAEVVASHLESPFEGWLWVPTIAF